MPKAHKPRAGSMGVWHRRRAKREYSRISSFAKIKDAKPLGFAGYKVGMTNITAIDNRKTSRTKGTEINIPVTVLECPPLKVFGIRFYKNNKAIGDIITKADKELARKISAPKNIKKKLEDIKEFDDLRLIVYTQPKLTGIGKKKPELFELAIGGKKEEKLAYAKEKLGKEFYVKDILTEGQQLDIHGVTKGYGYQGPVKRFGIGLKSHKSEKTKRGPGNLGPWKSQGHIMYRIAHAGQTGYHQRTEYNKWLLKIGDKPEEINHKGGWLRYGLIKNQYLLLKGSVFGPAKRMVRICFPKRENKKIPKEAPTIIYTNIGNKK